jgi:hypothetical protein
MSTDPQERRKEVKRKYIDKRRPRISHLWNNQKINEARIEKLEERLRTEKATVKELQLFIEYIKPFIDKWITEEEKEDEIQTDVEE